MLGCATSNGSNNALNGAPRAGRIGPEIYVQLMASSMPSPLRTCSAPSPHLLRIPYEEIVAPTKLRHVRTSFLKRVRSLRSSQ